MSRICGFSHPTHKEIISAFSVFNYSCQAAGLIKKQLQLLFTPGVNSQWQPQILSQRLLTASADSCYLHLEQIIHANK